MTCMISYDPLWATLKSRGLKHIDLVWQNIITPSALKKLQRGEPVSLNVVGSICVGLGITPNDVVEFKILDGKI